MTDEAQPGVPAVEPGIDHARRDVAAIADEVYDVVMAARPLEASLQGDHRFDAKLPDVSPDGLRATRQALVRLRAELDRTEPAALSTADRVTRDVAVHVADQTTHESDDRYVQSAAGSMTSGAGIGSAASALLAGMPKLVLAEPDHARDYLERCAEVPGHLARAEAQLVAGVRDGCVPAARLVAATVRQIDRYLAVDPARDPLLLDAPAALPDADRWRAAVADTLARQVRPALRRHRTVLADEVGPAARPDAQAGVQCLPGGDDLYRQAVALHTTTDVAAGELHQLGLDLIEDLAAEYRELGARVLGETEIPTIFQRLRHDPALRFTSPGQIRHAAEAALARAEQALDRWFPAAPAIPCEVREIPAVEAPESTLAYYQPPALDGTRPGVYFVNTTEPDRRSRFEAEVLAFHESVPGHHTQIATAMELHLPTLQRVTYLTAFAEGWGLYVERLADEMDLYSNDLSRLGMLSFDSWRACRLVVDTGMHAFGWSRDRAAAFMRTNSPQATNNIDNEVDRYIGWPGQALAYMTGRIRIMDLRRRAETILGTDFDVAAFHGVVLGNAAVPLRTLEWLIDDWLREARR